MGKTQKNIKSVKKSEKGIIEGKIRFNEEG
jgi:hypothetical protein